MDFRKLSIIVFLCVAALSFATFASCGNSGSSNSETHWPSDSSQSVPDGDESVPGGTESGKPSGNPFDGGLENGGIYNTPDNLNNN